MELHVLGVSGLKKLKKMKYSGKYLRIHDEENDREAIEHMLSKEPEEKSTTDNLTSTICLSMTCGYVTILNRARWLRSDLNQICNENGSDLGQS